MTTSKAIGRLIIAKHLGGRLDLDRV